MFHCGLERVKCSVSGKVSLWAGLMLMKQAVLPGLGHHVVLVTEPGLTSPSQICISNKVGFSGFLGEVREKGPLVPCLIAAAKAVFPGLG